MHLDHLAIFLQVIKHGSFSQAAPFTHYSPSGVMQKIKQLEADWQVSLFERSPQGAQLTDHGRRLVPYAQRILHETERSRQEVRHPRSPKTPIRIGCTEVFSWAYPSFLQSVLPSQEVDISLVQGSSDYLMDQLLANHLEAAWIDNPISRSQAKKMASVADRLGVVHHHAWEWRAWNDLHGVSIWMLNPWCMYRYRLEEVLEHAGASLTQLRYERIESLPAMVSLVAQGVGAALLPEECFQQLSKTHASLTFTPLPASHQDVFHSLMVPAALPDSYTTILRALTPT